MHTASICSASPRPGLRKGWAHQGELACDCHVKHSCISQPAILRAVHTHAPLQASFLACPRLENLDMFFNTQHKCQVMPSLPESLLPFESTCSRVFNVPLDNGCLCLPNQTASSQRKGSRSSLLYFHYPLPSSTRARRHSSIRY